MTFLCGSLKPNQMPAEKRVIQCKQTRIDVGTATFVKVAILAANLVIPLTARPFLDFLKFEFPAHFKKYQKYFDSSFESYFLKVL